MNEVDFEGLVKIVREFPNRQKIAGAADWTSKERSEMTFQIEGWIKDNFRFDLKVGSGEDPHVLFAMSMEERIERDLLEKLKKKVNQACEWDAMRELSSFQSVRGFFS